MSATSGLHGQRQVLSSQELVSQQIQGVSQQIQGLSADLQALGNAIQNLVAELSALQPPTHPGADASDGALEAYARALQEYQAKRDALRARIDDLNARSHAIANKIGDLQDKIRRLESNDMPQAQRNDQERNEQELKAAREKYENIAKAAESSTSKLDADEAAKRETTKKQMRVSSTNSTVRAQDTTSSSDQRLTLRVQWRTSEVKISETSDLKTLVRAFSLALTTVGDGSDFARRANPAIAMPSSPGSGLPPVGTP